MWWSDIHNLPTFFIVKPCVYLLLKNIVCIMPAMINIFEKRVVNLFDE